MGLGAGRGATLLKLVVDNPANDSTTGSRENTVSDADHTQSLKIVPDVAKPESGPGKPLGGDAT
jgi:hypothetical protein